jgi:uncharacterized protein
MTATKTQRINVSLDEDRLCALLKLDPHGNHSSLHPDDVIQRLTDLDVVITDAVSERVRAVCDLITSAKPAEHEFVVAEGTQPQPPIDAQLDITAGLKEKSATPPDDDAPVDYYATCRLVTVSKGDEVGELQAAVPGVDGVDLLGKPIPAKGKPKDITVGEGVRLSENGRTIRATRGGLVRVRGAKVSVVDRIEVDGDVGLETGSLDVDQDVTIKGTVCDMFTVKTAKSLSIGGAIESTTVQAHGDIVVRGGIAGGEKGRVIAGGSLVCRYCDGATVQASGDITITKEAINSHFQTRQKLMIPSGALIGGVTFARGGVEVRELGSEAEVATQVTIGLDPILLAKAQAVDAEVEKRMAAAEKIRTTVGPLMANIRRLAPHQRERATELMFEADTIQADADSMLEEKERMLKEGSWHEEPVLVVFDRVHPGTTLVFEELNYTCREIIRGPVRIRKHRHRAGVATKLVCHNTLTGSRRELMCRKHLPELPKEPPPTDGDAQPSRRA